MGNGYLSSTGIISLNIGHSGSRLFSTVSKIHWRNSCLSRSPWEYMLQHSSWVYVISFSWVELSGFCSSTMLASPEAALPPPWLLFTISANSSFCCWMNRQRDWVHSLQGSIIPRFFDLFCSCIPALYAACILINQTPRKCGTSNSYSL